VNGSVIHHCGLPDSPPCGDYLEVEASTSAAVSDYADFRGPDGRGYPGSDVLHVVSRGMFGTREGAPGSWLAVRIDGSPAAVRAVFANGASDEMIPVGGWAVLAVASA